MSPPTRPNLRSKPLGAEDLAAEDRGAEAGSVGFDRVDDRVGGLAFLGIPIAAVGQFRCELLAEQRWRHAGPAGARLSSTVEGISISTIGFFDQP